MSNDAGDAGYDEWIEALADGEGYSLRCPGGHHSLPPQRRCPHCAAAPLEPERFPETGVIETFSVVHIPTPAFADDAPYVLVIASFGKVRVTGQLRSMGPEDVTSGIPVIVDIEDRMTTGDPLVVFYPA